jgi:hypothetical protein
LEGQPQDVQDKVNAVNEALNQAEMDRDYYKAIVYGTWPDADGLIQTARKMAAYRKSKETQDDADVHPATAG